jgi:hypothetical protein
MKKMRRTKGAVIATLACTMAMATTTMADGPLTPRAPAAPRDPATHVSCIAPVVGVPWPVPDLFVCAYWQTRPESWPKPGIERDGSKTPQLRP